MLNDTFFPFSRQCIHHLIIVSLRHLTERFPSSLTALVVISVHLTGDLSTHRRVPKAGILSMRCAAVSRNQNMVYFDNQELT